MQTLDMADSVQRMVSRLRTPGLKADIEECVAAQCVHCSTYWPAIPVSEV